MYLHILKDRGFCLCVGKHCFWLLNSGVWTGNIEFYENADNACLFPA